MRHHITLGLLFTLAACTADNVQLEDARFATGSRTMVSDAAANRLFALNVDEGTVSRIDLGANTIDNIDLGVDPTRIARAGDEYFVTLRGERKIAVFRDAPTGLERLDDLIVGCEPHGIVASEDGSRLFVTLSQEARTIAIDVASRQVTDSWETPGDPRWVALNPRGDLLIVAPARGGFVYTVDTTEHGQEAVGIVEMPVTNRTTPDGRIELTPRIMGDMAFDPTGSKLLIPALYVDNKSQEDLPANVDPTTAYYTNPLPGVGRFNSALIEVPVAGGKVRENRAEAVFIASFTDGGFETMRSYPNAVSVSPDGLFYAVSLEGSDSVVMLGALPYNRGSVDSLFIDPGSNVDPLRHGFDYRPHVTMRLPDGSGPRAVAYTGDEQLQVHNFLSLTVNDIAASNLHEKVEHRGLKGVDDYEGFSAAYLPATPIEQSILPLDVREGRKLFYSATNTDLVATGAGVSCNTCHMDGRDDGLTWQLGPDVWQTPSLAGRVSDTHPVTWSKQIATVAAEAEATSRIRMGGGRLNPEEYALMAAYVDYTGEVDHPARGIVSDAVARGQVLFEREDVGCATCHSGVAYTDNDHHDLYGLEGVNTPPLRGIAATGPYLHDGRASTIRDVLELSRARVMGDTSMLTEAELRDLEAYVLSL